MATDDVILRSAPGCQAQAAHMDYIPQTLVDVSDEDMPILALIALQDNTRIYVWPGSNAHMINAKKGTLPYIEHIIETLKAGQVLLFRADLVHAGADYTELNYRLHWYYDSPHVTRCKNVTWVVHRETTAGELHHIILTPGDTTQCRRPVTRSMVLNVQETY